MGDVNIISAFMALVFLAIIILVIRLFGAWMLRINEVIKLQKDIINELREIKRLNK